MSNLVDIKIHFEQTEPFIKGEKLSGKIIVEPKEDLDIEYFSYQVICEQRGLASTEENQIKHKTILEHDKQLLTNKIYVYLIHFNTLNYETYKGKNIESLIKVEATLKLQNDLSTNKLLSKIGYITQGDTILASRYINVIPKNETYEISSHNVELETSSILKYFSSLFVITFFIVGISISTKLLQEYKEILFYLALIIMCIIILYGLLEFILIGKIQTILKDLENQQFQVQINNDLNWKFVKLIKVNYHISEEVIDRRGTTDTKAVFKVHSSKMREFLNPKQDISINFDYPKNKLPTYQINDLRIFWSIELKIISLLGIPFHLRSEFEVKRKSSTSLE